MLKPILDAKYVHIFWQQEHSHVGEQDFGLYWLLEQKNGGTVTTLEGNLGFNIANT